MKNIVIMLLMLGAFSACTSNQSFSHKERDEAYTAYIEKNELLSQDKIRTFKFNGWQTLSNNYLIISTSPRKRYLIEISGFCSNLYHAQTIAINQGMSSMLSVRFDSISVPELPAVKCFIKSIHKITKEQVKEISAIGKIAKEKAEEKS